MTQRFGGNGFFIELGGMRKLLAAFDSYETNARALRGRDWIVGSVVDHARHIEWGDRHRPGKHLLERAIQNVAATIGAEPSLRGRLARGLIVEDEDMLGVVAKMIQAEAERLTVSEDAVDTGELSRSWRARPA